MAKRRMWTAEEVALLRSLKKQKRDINECAAMLGRSKKAIEHKLYDKKEHFFFVQERGRKLSEEELQWVKDHYHNTRNSDIQQRFGISFVHLHRLARKHGLKKTDRFVKKTQRHAQEAAAESHRRNGTYPPKGYRIPNSDKNCFQKGENNVERFGKAGEKARRAKAAASRKMRYKMEKARVAVGLPQKTRLRVVAQSKNKLCYCYGLRKVGYIQDKQDKDLFYFPENGKRRLLREKNGAKFGIRFRRADDTKVHIEDISFASVDSLYPQAPKEEPKEVVAAFGMYPVSTKIVRNLKAYGNENSFSYD